MTHEKIFEAVASRGVEVLLRGHNRVGANVRTPELGVVVVVVIVRALPNTARAQDPDSKDPHKRCRQPRVRQYRLMLLIVINHEEPQIQPSSQETAGYFAGPMEIPQGPGHRGRQESGRGKQMPPTL